VSKPRRVRLVEKLQAQYIAGNNKTPTRKQAAAWLAPIRKAFREMKSGECDAYRGYAITRIHHCDNDFARVDYCINGFVAMLERVAPNFDVSAMRKVSKRLENGVLMTVEEIDACFLLLNQCETLLTKIPRNVLKDAAQTEQINIEFELLGLK